jgi:uncharacterized protein HemX
VTGALILQLLFAIGAGGIITTIVQGYFQRKKVGADYVTAVETSATRWVKAQEERILAAEQRAAQAEKRAEHAERSAQSCHRRVTQLESELRVNGITVPPELDFI